MQKGRAPIGTDGFPVNLHHSLQTTSGPLIELTQGLHTQHNRVLHINPSTIPSGINRPKFNAWRSEYWKQRAKEFSGGQ